MKLLLFTQILDENDDVLGFFHGWVRELSKHVDSLHVVCLKKGETHLPINVRVTSLGKERGASGLSMLLRLKLLVLGGVGSYDRVFVHMNPEYLVLFGWWWRLTGKKTALWYTHKSVDWKLRIAEKFANVIMTASSESFRLPSKKIHVMGHGIDTEAIHPLPSGGSDGVFRILSISRITKSKHIDVLIDAAEILFQNKKHIQVNIVGGAVTRDDRHEEARLHARMSWKELWSTIHFHGSIPNKSILSFLSRADCFVNCSTTGSLDKAVLEAMAAGVPVVTSNEGVRSTLEQSDGLSSKLMFPEGDVAACASRIESLMAIPQEVLQELKKELRSIVEKNHSLSKLAPKLIELLR